MKNFVYICLFCLSLQLQQALTTISRSSYYAGYKVYGVIPRSLNQVEVLAGLNTEDGVSFWDGPTDLNQVSTLLLSPANQKVILDHLRSAGLEVKESISNLQKLINREVVAEVGSQPFRLDQFHRLSDIYWFLNKLVIENADDVTLLYIGDSFENRPIYAVKISRENVNGTREGKKAIFLDANIHAREWISGAVMTYVLNELVLNPNYASWTEDFDFYLIIIANPDGFEYTHSDAENARMWRKTRSVYNTSTCIGTDPNRNFDYEWMAEGASSNPCVSTYGGPHAFSEKESQAIANLVTDIHEDLVFFGSVHACGQMILTPYGLTNYSLPEAEYNEYDRILKGVTEEISRKFGTEYTYGSTRNLLYPAAGGSADWAKGTFDTYLSVTFELRDKYDPDFGCSFILDATEIVPAAVEFMDGFQIIVEELRAKFIQKETEEECRGPDCGSTEKPDDGTTENPDDGTTEKPDDGTTEKPDDGTTEKPDDGTTEKPDDGTTENPDNGTTENPDDGSTEKPDDGTTENPDNGTTENPDNGTTENPEDGSTENLGGETTENTETTTSKTSISFSTAFRTVLTFAMGTIWFNNVF